MNQRSQPVTFQRTALVAVALLLFWAGPATARAGGWPLEFMDSAGDTITFQARPHRVVSLVPGITEMICRIGAADALVGVTRHGTLPPEKNGKTIVGGFFAPSVAAVAALAPDVIFYTRLQEEIYNHFAGRGPVLINIETESIPESIDHIRLLGRIFDREARARELVAEIQADLDLLALKVAAIPVDKRLRVVRLMGRDRVMAPGDDSFQNAFIRRAGGIPPVWGLSGAVVPVTLDAWRRFDPQVIYGCGGDRQTAATFFARPGWGDVEAVKSGRIFWFPCDLTCRAATHTADFTAWLAARINREHFADESRQVLPDHVRGSRTLAIDLPYVTQARIVDSRIRDFTNRTLLVDLDRPMTVVSTLEGQREGIRTVGNHYSPPPGWALGHTDPIRACVARICRTVERPRETTSLLVTGADMNNLAVQERAFREMRVLALVTAGVLSNAVRMAGDTGRWYEPGTINVILLTNTTLSPRAMTRAVISATEAKTAALWDMDIRSAETGLSHPATGTGTDNILVVQGTGPPIDNTGGHTKMGELIARAVYAGVQEAVRRQNGLTRDRHIFQRLHERGVTLFGMADGRRCGCDVDPGDLARELEHILLDSRYAGFVDTALALSDRQELAAVADLGVFETTCHRVAEELAGRPLKGLRPLLVRENLPPVLARALNALANGAYHRLQSHE